jgi:hypothetical protein
VNKVAKEHIETEFGHHLFRFYDQPDDWQETNAIGKLCDLLPGVFEIEKIKPQLSMANNFLELNSALKNWR